MDYYVWFLWWGFSSILLFWENAKYLLLRVILFIDKQKHIKKEGRIHIIIVAAERKYVIKY